MNTMDTMDTLSTTTTTVVVTEEKKRRRGLLWIGGAAAALLAGSSTFALWSDGAFLGDSGDKITAGSFGLEKTGTTTFYDVSADRQDAVTIPGLDEKGHAIDIDSWKMVPGDQVAAVMEDVTVELDGDNLVAKLSVVPPTYQGTQLPLDWTIKVFQNGTQVAAGTGDAVYLSTSPVDLGKDSTLVTPTGATYTVVAYGTFDEDTKDTDHVLQTSPLDTVGLQLDQVRDHGAFTTP